MALLEFVDEVERQLGRADLPFASDPVHFRAPSDVGLEKIIGANNLKSVAWLQEGLEVAKCVCRIVTPNGLGTGFLIEKHHIVTNCHVIPDESVAAGSRVEFNYQEDLRHRIGPVFSYTVMATSLRANETLDFSVVKVSELAEQPGIDSWGHLRLQPIWEARPGEHVSIIQHPNGGLKQVAVTANQVVNVFEHRLQYTTDTLPGSSGSPVFTRIFNLMFDIPTFQRP